mgnify:CR=1 FL=1
MSMNLVSNLASSVSGKVAKALLCVKKPSAVDVNNANNVFKADLFASQFALSGEELVAEGGALTNVDLRAKLAAAKSNIFSSSFGSVAGIASASGYHTMEVQYNPSTLRLNAHGGNQMMPGPGGGGVSLQMQSTIPAMTTLSVQLLFDKVNPQDAFMSDKFTNVTTPGAIVSDIAGGIKTGVMGGYSIQQQVEALIALILQAESREVVFYWGDMAFAGEIINMEASYTMFNPEGDPIRAVFSMTIKEGGQAEDADGEKYWDDAYLALLQGRSAVDKVTAGLGNILNLK